MTNDDGQLICDNEAILDKIKDFYQRLYSSSLDEETSFKINDYIDGANNLPRLSEMEKLSCEDNLTLEECFEVLKYFKNNKSPGCDGLSIEFYKTFWQEIGPKLVETLNYSKEQGELSISQRRGAITLLHKKGKAEENIKNWRPVSLLNNDYKIMTKVLAKRMEKVIPKLIHENQSGFVKGRFIGEGIRFIDDLIEYSDKYNKPGLILLLDFEKAFDTVEWKFLLKALNKFGFGENFIKWVELCYTNIMSVVGNSGFYTKWFIIYRGCDKAVRFQPSCSF